MISWMNFTDYEILMSSGWNVKVVWISMPPKAIVSAREFLFLEVIKNLGHEEFMIFHTSVDHPRKPRVKDPVRGEVFFRCWKFSPEGDGTRFTLCACVHPKGSVMKMIAGKAAAKLMEICLSLKKTILES